MNITDHLTYHLLFKTLSPEQKTRACVGATIIDIKKNSHLFEQGDEAKAFYYLLDGQIKLARLSPEGDEKIIEIISPGGTFAEALMFLRARYYPVAAQALKDSKLIRINSNNYYSVLNQSVDTCLAMLADLSSRLHGLVNEIDNLTLHNAACRVAGYLVSRVPDLGKEYELDVPKLALASRLAVKPETFSRIIKRLCTEKLIKIRGNHIAITNLEGLKEFSESCSQKDGSLADSFNLSEE